MATTVSEAIRRLTFVSSTQGVEKTTRDLRQLGGAQTGVAVASQKTERATLSMERRLESIQRQYDRNYRSARTLEKVERDLALAQAQGLVSLQRKTALLRLAEAQMARSTAATSRYAGAVAGLGGMLGVFAGTAAVAGLLRLLDASTRIANSLKVAGLDGEELTTVYDRLYASAQRNVAPVEALTQLYSRASLVQKELGASTEEMLRFTDRVAVALRVSGRSASESSGALLQLSQALGSGIVRAEEFNSMLEGALPIAQAAAAGLEEAGGSVARLRALVVDGKVSSQAFFRAFEAGSVILERKVAGAELTVSQHFIRLQNVLIATAGKFDDATGVTDALGWAITELSYVIEDFGDFLEDNQPAILKFFGSLGDGLAVIQQKALEIRTALGIEDFFEGTSLIEGRVGFKSDQPEGPMTGSEFRDRFKMIDRSRVDTGLARALSDKINEQNPVKPVTLEDFAIAAQNAAKQLSNARTETEKQTSALIAQADALGLGAGAAAAYQKEQELLNIAKRNGVALNDAEIAKIRELAVAYGEATLRLAEQTKLRDLAFDRSQMFRSPIERDVAGSLRDLYGDDWQDHANEAIAKQIRLNGYLGEASGLASDFGSTFLSALRNGESAMDALSKAVDKLTDKLIDMALQAAINAAFSGIFGGAPAASAVPTPHLRPSAVQMHSGGVVGSSGIERIVHPAYFDDAPRMHSGGIAGLRSDEVPAILQRGETVIPKGGSVAPTVVVTNTVVNNTSAQVRQEERRDGNGNIEIVTMIDDAVAGNIMRSGTKTNRALKAGGWQRPLR